MDINYIIYNIIILDSDKIVKSETQFAECYSDTCAINTPHVILRRTFTSVNRSAAKHVSDIQDGFYDLIFKATEQGEPGTV